MSTGCVVASLLDFGKDGAIAVAGSMFSFLGVLRRPVSMIVQHLFRILDLNCFCLVWPAILYISWWRSTL